MPDSMFILVLVTVFHASGGVATATHSLPFETRAACEAARSAVVEAVNSTPGTFGRAASAVCVARR